MNSKLIASSEGVLSMRGGGQHIRNLWKTKVGTKDSPPLFQS